MEFKEIQDILKLVNRTNLTEVEIENGDFKIKIKRKAPESNVIYTQQAAMPVSQLPVAQPAVSLPPAEPKEAAPKAAPEAPAKAEAPASDNLVEFKSPMIGTFYRASNPETPPFAKVGDKVTKGQVLCIIEAMKLFNEIESEISGTIVKILVEDSKPVEYDQPLFLIEPDA
ncbi:MAG: acetyl-CoA carboxylase biotin carboxyl carrier protein [Bacteroidia bacterium]|nr:acetyl-CoA carboxylase biotin carboxyl carrier protein [Bacteroidia bacterium]